MAEGASGRRRISLKVFEAAYVLELGEFEIREMVGRGELADAGSGRSVLLDPVELAELLVGRPVNHYVLEAIVDGRLHLRRDDLPTSVYAGFRRLG